ncbi:MAG: DUF1361 domain-containing protein [Caldilineaceae bacterium]|nr:DUF1361 domain-containing protein [Caldilineaceae bacterium]
MTEQTRAPHYWDKLPLLGILCISSGLSISILGMRYYYTGGSFTYGFLVWNLFLAWLPLVSALLLWSIHQSMPRARLLQWPLLLSWLAFFPNAPYLVTDFLHLTTRQNVPLWYDLLLIFSFAWNGLVLGFTALWIVQEVLAAQYNRVFSWLVVGFALATSGYGIYLGRFLRWNSWDLLFNPGLLASDIVRHLTDPLAHPRTIGVTLLFSSFMAIAYFTLRFLGQVRWQRTS